MQETIEFAVKMHAGQIRKETGLPYIVHPMAVMQKLADWGINNIDMWKAASCHDLVEDVPGLNVDELNQIIGENAMDLVLAMTHDSSKMTKDQYMESFTADHPQALLLKLADRVCNTNDYMQTNIGYSPKYWKKAFGLFSKFTTGRKVIEETFGKITYSKIHVNLIEINRRLTQDFSWM